MLTQPRSDQLVQAATAALANVHLPQAAALLDQVLAADPHHLMALTKQAELALLRKDPASALALTATALTIEPHFAPAWNQRSAACWFAGRQTEAVEAARQAVNIQPPNPEFRLRLAQFAAWTAHGNETREAIAPLLAAEQHDPHRYAAALSMLGELAIAEGRFEEAIPYLDRALEHHPGREATRMLRGMNRLRLGQFHTGWADYAVREDIRLFNPDGSPNLADQPWQGQDLTGKTLLVLDDQGHGDAIQFFRYLPLLRNRGAAHITWCTFLPLVRLLRNAAPYATVLDTLPEQVRFTYQCSSTSLPRWFASDLDTIPATTPYLRPLSVKYRKKPLMARPQVGLVWSGDARHARDHLRSIPAEIFLSLADIPGIAFHSLQHQVRAFDLPALTARPSIRREVERAADLAETAAILARLDLVITVDTAIAHLAGAMGRPVWILLHVAPDWRWMTDRTTTPWYPTAQLFRVTPPEWLNNPDRTDTAGWRPVLNRVASALRTFAKGPNDTKG